jgi:hypothetical protein
MTTSRCFGRLAAAAVILLATALPGAADGLSQFEQKIRPQLPPDSFTHANAKALGDNCLVLEKVVVTFPAEATGGAKAEPVAIKRVSVEDFDFAGLDTTATSPVPIPGVCLLIFDAGSRHAAAPG